MFKTNPGDEGYAEAEVEEAFVGDCEKHKDRSEGQEDHHKAMEVMVVWLQAMEERHKERKDYRCQWPTS